MKVKNAISNIAKYGYWGFFLVRVGIMTIQSVWEAASDSQYGKTKSLLGRNHYKGCRVGIATNMY